MTIPKSPAPPLSRRKRETMIEVNLQDLEQFLTR
jgi:hypothetical protein